jgi:hypothetical protein
LHRALALDYASLQKPLHNIGERRPVDPGQPDEIRLAQAFVLRNRRNYRILPCSEVEIPGFLRKNFRRPLTRTVKKMNDRFVYGVGACARRFLSLPPRLAQPCFCVQHSLPAARLNSEHCYENE